MGIDVCVTSSSPCTWLCVGCLGMMGNVLDLETCGGETVLNH